MNSTVYYCHYLSFCIKPILLPFQDGANLVKKIKGVYCFKVKGADGKEGVWVVDVKNGTGSVKFDSKGELTCCLHNYLF